jgi:hypothetical protein
MGFEKLKCSSQVGWPSSRCFVSVLLSKRSVNLFCLVRQNHSSLERRYWDADCCIAGTQQRSEFGDLRQTGQIHTLRQLRQLGPIVGRLNLSTVSLFYSDSSSSMAIQTTSTVSLSAKMTTSFFPLQMIKLSESGTCTSFSASPS